jgi:hypothetical protein
MHLRRIAMTLAFMVSMGVMLAAGAQAPNEGARTSLPGYDGAVLHGFSRAAACDHKQGLDNHLFQWSHSHCRTHCADSDECVNGENHHCECHGPGRYHGGWYDTPAGGPDAVVWRSRILWPWLASRIECSGGPDHHRFDDWNGSATCAEFDGSLPAAGLV